MNILSGIQPSGTLHLGNYFGMMRRMVRYQDEGTLFAFIANYHALTTVQDGEQLRNDSLSAAIDFLSLGIDPQRSIFWLQSDVPEVLELTWILSTLTPMGLLERAHSYKDKVARGIPASHGLFAYPVLMAADILLFESDTVPVGKDQIQHVEMARDMAEKFNLAYGPTLKLPEADVDQGVATVPGTDGQKMSKSYGNTIDIFAEKDDLRGQVLGIVTDSTPVDQPKSPDTCNLFAIYALFRDEEGVEDLRRRYLAPGLKYSEVKQELAEVIWERFARYRERRDHLLQNRDEVLRILAEGAARARSTGTPVLERVRRAVGIDLKPG